MTEKIEKSIVLIEKRPYCTPKVEMISLDHEISLVMYSPPSVEPGGPWLPEAPIVQKIFKFGW